MVEPRGLEPLTPCLQSPGWTEPLPIAPRPPAQAQGTVVEPRGLEPLTPCLQSRCATNCAKAPGWDLVPGVGQPRETESVASAQSACSFLPSSILRFTTSATPTRRTSSRIFFMVTPQGSGFAR